MIDYRIKGLLNPGDCYRAAVCDFIDNLRERRYLFWKRFGIYLNVHYLWNGGWSD